MRRLIVLIVMLTAALCLFRIGLEGRHRSVGQPPEDFLQYYAASCWLLHGESVYQLVRIPDCVDLDFSYSPQGAEFRYPNPPAFAIALAPLALLSYQHAWWVMFVLSLLLIGVCCWRSGEAAGLGSRAAVLFSSAAIGSFPVFVLLVLNHIESIILGLAVYGWLELKRERQIAAGTAWGLAAAFKLFPLFWLLTLLLSRRFRRAGAAGLACFAAVTLISAALIGKSDSYLFLKEVLSQSANYYSSKGNFSLLALGTALHDTRLGWLLTAGGAALLIGWQFRGAVDADKALTYSVVGSLLLSPLTWSYNFILLIPCFAVAIGRTAPSAKQELLLVGLIICATVFWPSMLGGWLPPILSPAFYFFPLIAFVPTVGLLAFYFSAGSRQPGSAAELATDG